MNAQDLRNLSEAYTQLSTKKDDSYLETDMKKRRENNEKAVKDMKKMGTMKNPHFEEVEKFRTKMAEGLDPVGKEDGDVNNDGKKDSTDKYLMKRRAAIGKAMGKRNIRGNDSAKQKARLEKKRGMKLDDHPQFKKEEVELDENRRAARAAGGYKDDSKKQTDPSKKGFTGIGNMSIDQIRKMSARIEKEKTQKEGLNPVGKEDADIDNDGDTDKSDKYLHKRRKAISAAMKKRLKESRNLTEIISDGEEQKEIKEKKVKNTVKINPKLGEAVEEIGGTIIEMVEVDQFNGVLSEVFQELLDEGYSIQDAQDALEEATVTYGHDTEKPHKKDTSTSGMVKAVGRLARQKLKSAGKKARLKAAQAQVSAYNKGREVKQKAGDKVRGAKSGIKGKIKRAAQKVVDRMSEETSMSQQEIRLQKRKAMIDQMIARKRKQSLDKAKGATETPAKAMGEELSVDQQMKISQEYNRKSPEEKRAANSKLLGTIKKVKREKDTRTCLLYTSPSPRDATLSRMPSSA